VQKKMAALMKLQNRCAYWDGKKGCRNKTNCPYPHDNFFPPPKFSTPCRYFNEPGGCWRGGDCYFVHKKVDQKSNNQGGCRYGKECIKIAYGKCKFPHPERKNSGETKIAKEKEKKTKPKKPKKPVKSVKSADSACRCSRVPQKPKVEIKHGNSIIRATWQAGRDIHGTWVDEIKFDAAQWKGLLYLVALICREKGTRSLLDTDYISGIVINIEMNNVHEELASLEEQSEE